MGRIGQLYVIRYFRSSFKSHVIGARCLQTPSGAIGSGIIPSISSSTVKSLLRPSSVMPHLSTSSFATDSPKSPDFSQLPGARVPKNIPLRSPKVLEISRSQANDAFQHSLELVRKHDVDSYLSVLTMPKEIQPELIVVLALNVELALIRDKIDPRGGSTSGMYRLQFWKDALSSIYGNAATPVPRQPVAIGLCSFAPNANASHLEALVISRQQSLGDRPFASVFEVCGYGAKTAGSLIHLSFDALTRHLKIESDAEEVTKAVSDIGGAYGVMNLIRSTLPLMTRGVVLLPSDLLSLNNLTADKVYKKKQPEDVCHVVRDMLRVAEKHLESGRKRVNSFPKPLRHAFTSTATGTDHLIKLTKKVNYDIYSSSLQRRDPLLLWRLTWRKLIGRC